MKLQNIFALIVTLIGFAACTSESELLDTAVNDDLVPVTISLGSMQTKASVGLDTDEGTIQNAIIGIFDSNGIPTVAPIVLGKENSKTTRLPLVKSNAYAFVNVSAADIDALKNISSMNEFKDYAITKQLTQVAASLPKYGAETNFTPTENGNIAIDVHQLTARLDVSVNVIVTENGEGDVTAQHPEIELSKSSVSWTKISDKNENITSGIDGSFTTEIGGANYNVINRAYSYPGTMPVLSLQGEVNGKDFTRTHTMKDALEADNVYLLRATVKYDLVTKTVTDFTYEVVKASSVDVNVPSFN